MRHRTTNILIAQFVVVLAAAANGDVLIFEDFEGGYFRGPIAGQQTTGLNLRGTWTASQSSIYSDGSLITDGGNAKASFGNISILPGHTIYFAADMTPTSSSNRVMAYFSQGMIIEPTGEFKWSINGQLTGIQANFNQRYRFVFSVENNSHLGQFFDVARLWIDPQTNNAAPDIEITGDYTPFTAFEVSLTGKGIFDDIVVATTFAEAAFIPEPSVLAVWGVMLFGLFRRKKASRLGR